MSDEIIKAPNAGVGAPAPMHVEGLDEVLPEQVEAPLLSVVQSQSKGVGAAPMGSFFLRSNGRDYGPKINFIPIGQFNSRVFFEKDQAVPTCTSKDGKKPDGGSAPPDPRGIVAHDCERCYFAQRPRDRNNPRATGAAPCAAQINFLGLALGPKDKEADAQLCVIRLKRTSWKVGRAIVSNAQFNARTVKTLWGFVYELSTKIEEGKIGKYAVPYHAVLGLTDKFYPKIEDVARGYAGIWSGLRAKLVEESFTKDEEEDFVEAPASSEPAPASASGDALPKDDLPF